MSASPTRRQFLRTSAVATTTFLAPRLFSAAPDSAPTPARSFSFVLLGDLHYDKLEHHDLAWLQRTHPGDLSQIQNYARITRDITPQLFARVRQTIAELNRSRETRVAFVLQAGDLVEGLCGSEERATRQNEEALAFVQQANLGAPLLFTKGNHDITGDGAPAAFRRSFFPFLDAQRRLLAADAPALTSACFTVQHGPAEFVFFDAYQPAESLGWLESVLAQRRAEHLFVAIHPPVVPYGARSTWHIFSAERERAKREKLLELLGRARALVLGGHIHRYNTLARETPKGRFAQFALSSIINGPDVSAKTELRGVDDYTPDQVKVEPQFSPETETARRAVYEAEGPLVKAFEYADLPGYAVVSVTPTNVSVKMYPGISTNVWRTVDLTRVARGVG
jgi:hypothetical protein